MKRHIIFCLLASVLVNALQAQTFILDLNGVTTYVSRLQAGIKVADGEFTKNFLAYCIETKQNPLSAYKYAQMRAFEVMHNYCKNNKDESLTHCFDGTKLCPALMAQMWRGDFSETAGQLHGRLAVELFAKEKKFISCSEYCIIKKIIHLIFCSTELSDLIYPFDDMVDFIEKAAKEIDPKTGKKKHQIFILSNMPKEVFEKIKTRKSLKKLFNLIPESHWVISGQVKMIKPNKNIYEYVLNTFNLNAQDCVFVDDQEENIKTAAELGFNVIHCTSDRKAVFKQLKAFAKH
jgi:HAD superfamily hydrolase (TIGR01509 family)